MAEGDSQDDKTEAPSDKRRSETREEGTVSKSTEINSVLVLLAGLFILNISGPWMYRELARYFLDTFMLISKPSMEAATVQNIIVNGIYFSFKISAPVVLGILFVGVLANYIQVGFLFTLKPLIPKFSKIDPFAGTKRMFSSQSVAELLKSILKLAIIGTVAYYGVKAEFGKFLMLADTSVAVIWVFMLKTSYIILMKIVLALIIIAIFDFAWQRFSGERQMRMTKQEVKEEHKQMEGDPQVKGRIRSLQREMARRRMMKEVPKATVVVTNPTHIAIALQYESGAMKAPLVLAKGKRLIAERIREIARAAGVPIVEDKPLARAMYDKIDVGFEIPVEFFTAVAEILAYVYRLKNRAAA